MLIGHHIISLSRETLDIAYGTQRDEDSRYLRVRRNVGIYYSRSGNTKAVAEAIAKEVGVEAVSVDQSDAALSEPADVLFVGGALYAYGIDDHLKEFLQALKKEDAKKAVVFSTSWLSKHAIDLIKKGLSEAVIAVAEEFFYVRGKPGDGKLNDAAEFARKFL